MFPPGAVNFRFLTDSMEKKKRLLLYLPASTLPDFFPVSELPSGLFVCLWVISRFICSAPSHLRILTARSSDAVFWQQIPSSSM